MADDEWWWLCWMMMTTPANNAITSTAPTSSRYWALIGRNVFMWPDHEPWPLIGPVSLIKWPAYSSLIDRFSGIREKEAGLGTSASLRLRRRRRCPGLERGSGALRGDWTRRGLSAPPTPRANSCSSSRLLKKTNVLFEFFWINLWKIFQWKGSDEADLVPAKEANIKIPQTVIKVKTPFFSWQF